MVTHQMETHNIVALNVIRHVHLAKTMVESVITSSVSNAQRITPSCSPKNQDAWPHAQLDFTSWELTHVTLALIIAWTVMEINLTASSAMPKAPFQLCSNHRSRLVARRLPEAHADLNAPMASLWTNLTLKILNVANAYHHAQPVRVRLINVFLAMETIICSMCTDMDATRSALRLLHQI